MEMPGAEGWPLEKGVESSIALSSDLEILGAETAGKTGQRVPQDNGMDFGVARKETCFLIVEDGGRMRDGARAG